MFTDHALWTGWKWSRELPWRLNTWARACLMAPYAAQLTVVDNAVTTTAATELQWAGTV